MSKAPTNEPVLEEAALLPHLVDIVISGGRRCFLMDDGRVEVQLKQGAGEPVLIPPRGTSITWLLPDAQFIESVYKSLNTDKTAARGLFERVRKDLKRHAKLPEPTGADYYALLAAWAFATYRQDWFGHFPILFLFGVAERGKNRIGDSLAYVSYRGFATETANEAPLFWWADYLQPTLFVDVVNITKKASAKGSLDVICGRFERGKKVIRVNPDKGGFAALRSHDIFGPTIIATNDMPEERLLTRGLLIVMPEAKKYRPPPKEDELVSQRGMLTAWRRWTMTAGQSLDPDIRGIGTGRWRDITQGLRQITSLVAPDYLDSVDRALDHLWHERQGQKSCTDDAGLIEVVRALLQAQTPLGHGDRVPSEEILGAFKTKMGWDKVTGKYIGAHMRGLGFEPIFLDGGKRRGWRCTAEKIEELEQKYGLDARSDDRSPDSPTPIRQPSVVQSVGTSTDTKKASDDG